MSAARGRRPGLLDRIERIGNALPDPTTLFLIGAVLVALLSQLAVGLDWTVEKTVTHEVVDAATGETHRVSASVPVKALGLLSSDGIYWILSTLVKNFMEFPPLGVVLVGMLGIGFAERTGFIGALLKAVLLAVPTSLLTPAVFFVGVMSSMGLDAGYVVLPPVAAALYLAVGRSPLVGLAAVFAGVSAGFSANLFLTSLDPLLAEFSTTAAHLIDPDYTAANLWFMMVSTLLLTGVGWAVTAWWVEPRFAGKPPSEGGPEPVSREDLAAQRLSRQEVRGLALASAAALLALLLFAAAALVPGAPLSGSDGSFPRWVRVIVPLIFLAFLIPGLVYGFATDKLHNDRDVAKIFGETMAGMGPYIVLAFFAAQFIAWFAHSGLGEMLALCGGRLGGDGGEPLHRLDVGEVRLLCARLRADVHAGRGQPRAHPGRLPGRRLGHQCDHATQSVRGHPAGLHAALRPAGRHRNTDGVDAALRHRVRRHLDPGADRLDRERRRARARRSPPLPVRDVLILVR
jgi:aminobenzoyl-glutamate transport protein